MFSLALSGVCSLFFDTVSAVGGGPGSGGRENEEIRTHKHEPAAGPVSKQEAGEQHAQKVCDGTVYSRYHQ